MSWLSDLTGLSESEITLPSPSWTGTVETATASGVTAPSTTGLINSISSTIGNVADFGFKVQNQQLDVQAKSQDTQLKRLLGTLGFQTQVVQAQSAADIAKINAQKAVAQASGAGSSLSPIVLVLGAGLIYFMAKKG